jgi:site-specific DNA recombinase
MLEAERSKDEVRDILSRVIGAEIRYTQMGYYMRRPPYGFISEKVETQHGKRTILKPHPEESKFIIKLFELQSQSAVYRPGDSHQKLNDTGYRGRTQYRRSKTDRSRIIGKTEGALLNDKKVWRIVRNPIYTGIIVEKWTKYQPVKAMFDGLISVELFNRANRGKRTIIEMPGNKIAITDNVAARNATPQGTRNNDFAFKHYVMCPQCNKPLSGSTSRGKTGKYYSYYHCDKRGHKFRVSKEDLEAKIYSFIDGVTFSQERIDKVFAIVRKKYEQHIATYEAQTAALSGQITTLEAKARELTRSFATIAPSAQKYVNEELEDIDVQIKRLALERTNMENKKPIDIDTVLDRIRKFSENIGQAIAQQSNDIKKAQLFGLLFKTLPTYNDLRFRNRKTPLFTGVHPVFQLLAGDNLHLVTPAGFEPAIFWMRTRYPKPLDDGASATTRLYHNRDRFSTAHHSKNYKT